MEKLQRTLYGTLIRRDDEGYDGASVVWNGMTHRYPAVIAAALTWRASAPASSWPVVRRGPR